MFLLFSLLIYPLFFLFYFLSIFVTKSTYDGILKASLLLLNYSSIKSFMDVDIFYSTSNELSMVGSLYFNKSIRSLFLIVPFIKISIYLKSANSSSCSSKWNVSFSVYPKTISVIVSGESRHKVIA